MTAKKANSNSATSAALPAAAPASYTDHATALSEELALFTDKLAIGAPISPAQRTKLRPGYDMSDRYIQSAAAIVTRFGAKVGGTNGQAMLDAVRRNGAMAPVAAELLGAGELLTDTLYGDIGRAGLEARAIEDALDTGVNRRGIAAFVKPLKTLRDLRKSTKRATRPRKPASKSKKPAAAATTKKASTDPSGAAGKA